MRMSNVNSANTIRGGISRITHNGLVAAAVVILAVSTSTAFANHHTNTTTGMTLAGVPLAIHGYDAVAYFTEGRAVVGWLVTETRRQYAAKDLNNRIFLLPA